MKISRLIDTLISELVSIRVRNEAKELSDADARFKIIELLMLKNVPQLKTAKPSVLDLDFVRGKDKVKSIMADRPEPKKEES